MSLLANRADVLGSDVRMDNRSVRHTLWYLTQWLDPVKKPYLDNRTKTLKSERRCMSLVFGGERKIV